ncbi:MAG: CbiX/SirB N-terminal domain-containing protein [Thermoguttaceae bacterium]|nr:CbiX/SirB N-terminal domain-containing protein [Thermoguttaceae bacterium]
MSFKTFILSIVVALFGTSVAFCQPVSSAIPQERAAVLNRPLESRGEKIGLLLVFHGSPSPEWGALTGELVEKVRKINETERVFVAIEGADMEFNSTNDVVAGFERLESAGCDAVVATPAFIYPTGHVQFDVVSILGVYSDANMREQLAAEGIRIVRSKIPTTVTPTFSSGDLLKNFVLAEARSILKDPRNERLLVIAHGDDNYAGLVNSLTADALAAARELGFDAVQSAFCEMGQSFAQNVAPIVEKNTKENKTTLIVAIYLASSAQTFVERVARARNSDLKVGELNSQKPSSMNGLNYRCSNGCLGKFDETPTWIYETARAAAVF